MRISKESELDSMINEHAYNVNDTISLAYINVCGLKSKCTAYEFEETLNLYDIICVGETKLDRFDTVDIDGFQFYSCIRQHTTNRSGGFGIFIKRCYTKFVVIAHKGKHVMALKISEEVFGFNVLLLCIYIPPEGSRYYDVNAFAEIESVIIDNREDNEILVLGDFNARTANVPDYVTPNMRIDSIENMVNEVDILLEHGISLERFSQDKNTNNAGYRLIELCKNLSLFIANGRIGSDHGIGKFTCKNASVVDYIIMSAKVYLNAVKFRVNPFCALLSDVHSLISCDISTKPKVDIGLNDTVNTDQTECTECEKSSRWLEGPNRYSDSIDMEKVNDIYTNMIKASENVSVISKDDVQAFSDSIVQILNDSALKNGNIKKKRVNKGANLKRRTPKKPWYDADCEAKRREFHRRRNMYRNNSCEENLNAQHAASKEYKKALKTSMYKYKRELNKKLHVLRSNNSKEYWSIINNANKSYSEQAQNMHMGRFVEHFRNLNNPDEDIDTSEAQNMRAKNTNKNETLDKDFTLDELKTVVYKLKSGKSPGLDGILNEFIKYSFPVIGETLTCLFNIVLNTGHIPEEWCVGVIVPIYKNKGQKSDPDNYRGITLLSCIGKLFTAALNHRLCMYLDEFGVLGEEQAGFRAGYSTTDHIFVLNMLIELYNSRKNVFIVLSLTIAKHLTQ